MRFMSQKRVQAGAGAEWRSSAVLRDVPAAAQFSRHQPSVRSVTPCRREQRQPRRRRLPKCLPLLIRRPSSVQDADT